MEGWLYMIRSSRLGLQYSRKRYFVFKDGLLNSFKCIPHSNHQDLVRSAVIDSCIRVVDNGPETIRGKVFYIFTVYNTSSHDDQLKLGASSSDEAALWIQAFQDQPNSVDKELGCWKSPCRFSGSLKLHPSNSIQCNLYSTNPDSCEIVGPSPWTIFGCQNGLRLFQESNNHDSFRKDDRLGLMAVGVVEGTSEAIFKTLMSLGTSRSEWDFCFDKGSVVEHIDGHTDMIHKQFRSTWMPRGMKRRDLVLRRFWRRGSDGTYVIMYHSVFHKRCPVQKGYVRACMKFGGYVICPTYDGKRSVVRHMLTVDWKFWTSYHKSSHSQTITIKMLERIAALREMFKARSGNMFSSEELSSDTRQSQCCEGINDWKDDVNGNALENAEAVVDRTLSSLSNLNEADDEFYDVPNPSDYDLLENIEGESSYYVRSFIKDPTGTIPSSYCTSDPSNFFIRGKNYLKDRRKVEAKEALMQIVGADWVWSDKREGDFGARPNSIVQNFAAKGGHEFFFIINFQLPGPPNQNVVLYYMMSTPLEDTPLLDSFVNGDDAFRRSRFKLIPSVTKGPWIVKQTVRNRPYLLGQYINMRYFRGKNYMELALDIGSSSLARAAANLVIGYLNNLVIDIAFLIQANTYEELPEFLIGTCRINHLDQPECPVKPT